MPSSRPRSLRRLLGVLSVVLTLPMLALALAVGALQVGAERWRLEAGAMYDARQLLQRTERLIAEQRAALRRLAREVGETDPAHALAAFRVATGLHLTLLDAEGAPRAETRTAPLPAPARDVALGLARDGGLVSPLVTDPESGGHALLLVESAMAGLLVLALPAARLQSLLTDMQPERFDRTRFPTMVDADGRIVTCWHSNANRVGQLLPPEAHAALTRQLDGLWQGANLEGMPVLIAHAASASTGLTISVGVTEAALAAPIWRAALQLGPLALLLLSLAGLAGVLAARRIAGPVASLGAAAAALAEGKPPPRLATPVTEVNAVAKAMADAAERRQRAEGQRDLLVRELHHRVKNLLATAQSLATLSARSARDPADFAAQFGDRLRSLARTHTMLLEEPEGVLALRSLMAEVVAPYRIGIGRIAMTGPEVRLPAEAAVPLGMVLHELATNALKYGALSVVEGRLDVNWRLVPAEGAPLLVVDWVESDGPAIAAPPQRQGFGSQLLRRALAGLPDGKAEVTWRAEGLAVRLTLSLRGAELRSTGPGAAPQAATS